MKKLFSNPYAASCFAVLCALLWGSALPCIKLGYDWFAITGTASQILFAGCRFSLAGIATLLMSFAIVGVKLPPKKSLVSIGVLALLQTTLQYIFFYVGAAHVTGVSGSVINAAGAFFAVMFAPLFFKSDRLSAQKILGCVLGFAGIVCIHLGGTVGSFSFLGEGFMLLAAGCFAAGSFLSKWVAKSCHPMLATGWQLTFGGLLLILLGWLTGGHFQVPSLAGGLLLAYLAFLSAAAFTLWALLLDNNPVGNIAVFNFLNPVFGVLLCVVFLNEKVAALQTIVSLILVCTGIILVNKTQKKKDF